MSSIRARRFVPMVVVLTLCLSGSLWALPGEAQPWKKKAVVAHRGNPVEARIDAGTGDREAARAGLVEVRRELLAREMSYDAALVSLELALLSIEEGRTAEVKALAEEMVLLFQSLEVQPEALASLAMFQKAAALESATAASVRQILALLEKSHSAPLL